MPVCITLQKLWDIVPLIVNGNSDEALDSSEPIALGHCVPFLMIVRKCQSYACNAFWGQKLSWLEEFWD